MARFNSTYRDPSEVAKEEDVAGDQSIPVEEAANPFGASAGDDAYEEQPGIFARFGTAGLLIIAIISSGAAYYFYREARLLKENPQKIAQEEVTTVVGQVGRLLVLPEGETPTLATVSDVDRLKSQPFFAHAKNGDKVLIYTSARKAILYSPEQNKIVEVSPLNLGGQ